MDLDPNPPPLNPVNLAGGLELDFQSLNLYHKEEIQIDLEDKDPEPIRTASNLLFKVGPPDGIPARIISGFVFERAMRAAWGSRFYKVTHLAPNYFMAHFRSDNDLRWVWQRQPWLVDRETMLVEYADPSGNRAKESYTFRFRYLPVNIHIYGIPKTPRSVDLIKKIIDKVGLKDSSVPLSENAMFRVPEYVFARVILDVTKPLLDRISISISKEKKINVYVHYEKLVKICNFCGLLFHNVANCSKRNGLIMNLNPSEALKVPENIYGKWRTIEQEIPPEAKEDMECKSQNAYIQSFKDFFQNSASSWASSASEGQSKGGNDFISNSSDNMQIVLSHVQCQSTVNASTSSGNISQISEVHQTLRQEWEHDASKMSSNNRVVQNQTGLVSSSYGSLPVEHGIFGSHGYKSQVQLQTWQSQGPFPLNMQWQQQQGPFVFHGSHFLSASHMNQQDLSSYEMRNVESNSVNRCFALPAPDLDPKRRIEQDKDNATGNLYQSHASSSAAMADSLNLNQGAFTFSHGSMPVQKSKASTNPNRLNSKFNSNLVSKRQGSPLVQPFSKKAPSSPFYQQPRSPTPSSSPDQHQEQLFRSKRRNGGHSSRWDQEATNRDHGNYHQKSLHQGCENQVEGSDHIPDLGVNSSRDKSLPQTVFRSDDTGVIGGGQPPPVIADGPDYDGVVSSSTDGHLAPALKAPPAP